MPTPFDKLRSDDLRADPLFKLAVGRAPESGRDLCSQPTMSRLENAPSRIEVARLTAALVDIFCRSFDAPPAAIVLDIDDTCDAAHGHQQLSLFNAHYDTRCFLPVHVYHVESGKPVAVLLRPGKTPSGVEVRILIKHLVGRIRRHWPRTRLTFRGDSHYGRREAMDWCEANGVEYIFGLAGNAVLHALADGTAADVRARHARTDADKVRGFAEFDYAAGSWHRLRRVVAGIEATARGFDARYIVTSLTGEPRHLYEGIYCARSQAENLR
ncbi:MAG: IS1380 family transposase [Defluviicoccus sp.]|nr:IS1380 family transposase [Defluviicoccus sp.]MDE0274252.1 IS1380 family transposase [Defluviicoccus sp.]